MTDIYRPGLDDVVVLVDDDDRMIGTAPKREVHHAETPLHRGFSIFLFNDKGQLLLQRRARTKKTWPGVWSNSCCGHPFPGETVEAAASRRLDFELGLKDIELKVALPNFRYRVELDGIVENEICPVLISFTNKEPVTNPDEVEEFMWVDWDEFTASLDDLKLVISPWAILEAKELLGSNEFRKEYAHAAGHD